jgi:hypothetical protein
MSTLASTLLGRGLRRGLLGGQRRWQGILLVVLVGRLARALGGRRPVVHRTRLEEGGTIQVKHLARGVTDR